VRGIAFYQNGAVDGDEPPVAPTGRKMDVQLGQRIRFRRILLPWWWVSDDERYVRGWTRGEVAEQHGIVFGARTLYTGEVVEGRHARRGGPYDPPEWEPGYRKWEQSHRALLVATDLRRKPYIVLTDDAEVLDA